MRHRLCPSFTIANTSRPGPRAVLFALLAIFIGLGLPQSLRAQVGYISTVAGNGNYDYKGDNGPATGAALRYPSAVVVDGSGNFYIADKYNGVIRFVSAKTGTITTFAGGGNGCNNQTNYVGDGCAATSANFDNPIGVRLDSSGNLYIADQGHNRIRMVTLQTGIISTVAGNGNWGYTGDNGNASTAKLNSPSGIALDQSGNLYIADSGNNVVRMVNTSGIITTVAGNGTQGYSGNAGAATSAEMNNPTGVAVDTAGDIYIADYNNHVVRVVNGKTGIITTAAGNGKQGYAGDGLLATSAELYNPAGLALDAAGNLYIADAGNSTVRKVTTKTGVITSAAGNGTEGYNGDTMPATGAELDQPFGVGLDSSGNLYIADTNNERIRMVAEEPPPPVVYSPLTITTVAGYGGENYSGDGSLATAATLSNPTSVALDSSSNLYIADDYNSAIRMVNAQTGIITTIAGRGNDCPADTDYLGDGCPATSAYLNDPTSVAIDSSNNIYIADRGHAVIRRVNAKTGIITTIAGNQNWGYSGDKGLATDAELYQPTGVALDALGNLYIADTGNNVVRMVTVKGIITTIAGNGTSGYIGDTGTAVNAELSSPTGVVLDASGNLYIADNGNNVIRKVSKTGIITTIAGVGVSGYSGDSGPATSAELNAPWGVSLDGFGNLYIGDSNNHAIRKVSASTGNITTVAGNGTQGYNGDEIPATTADLNYPAGTAFDRNGNMYIADQSNQRIRKVWQMGPGTTATPTFSPAGGTYTTAQTVTILDTTSGATIYYTTNGSTPATSSTKYTGAITVGVSETLQAIAVASGSATSTVGSATYVITEVQTTMPTFTPAAGTYSSTQEVTIKAASGATIYYTVDGSTPTTSSAKYSSAIPISKTTTVKALAVAAGYLNSQVASATYTIEARVLPPVITPAGGVFGAAQTASITDETSGASIYYTTDGSTPTTASKKYSAHLPIYASTTLKAIAVATGDLNSTMTSASFTMVDSPAVITGVASSIATPKATLSAMVNDSGSTATLQFAYGLTKQSMTSYTGKITVAAGSGLQLVQVAVSGLKAKTTYYFQPTATNLGGSSSGAIASFTTN